MEADFAITDVLRKVPPNPRIFLEQADTIAFIRKTPSDF
jgi:hypothetical protein